MKLLIVSLVSLWTGGFIGVAANVPFSDKPRQGYGKENK